MPAMFQDLGLVDPLEGDPIAQQRRAAQMLQQQQAAGWRANPKAKPYVSLIGRAASQHGVPTELMGSLIERESQFNPEARSPAGAVGLAQLMPIHHKMVNPRDPGKAVDYSAKYLGQLYKRFGSWDKALAAYNYGPANVSRLLRDRGDQWKASLPAETQNYINALAGLQ